MHATMTNLPGDKFGVTVDSQTIGGHELHRLTVQVGGASVQIWLTPEQLMQLGFAISCAEQEAALETWAAHEARVGPILDALAAGKQ